MPQLQWSEKFSVNSEELDGQHKKLIGLINSLYYAKEANNDEKIVEQILSELVEYTRLHFRREEELMALSDYPDKAEHISEHEVLVNTVLELKQQYYTGKSEVSTDIAILLNDWIADHILVVDKKYSPFLKNSI